MPASPQRGAPVVPAVGDGPRPTWSVMIPTYEAAEYLPATLRSVLDQAPGVDEMEIVVVDDHSLRDDVGAVVAGVAGDRVRFVRQPRNVGHVRNFNTCLRTARGHLVHLLHGDDVVLPGFYDTMGAALAEQPAVGAAICRYRPIDGAGREVGRPGPLLRETPGVLDGWLRRIAAGQAVQPPALVVRRAVYERIGGFVEDIEGYAEDWELLVRIAAGYPVWFEPAVLAAYRVRPGSLSDVARLRRNMHDMRQVLALNEATMRRALPEAEVAAATAEARRALSEALVRRARRRLRSGDTSFPGRTVLEALRFDPRPATAARVAGLTARWAARRASPSRRRA